MTFFVETVQILASAHCVMSLKVYTHTLWPDWVIWKINLSFKVRVSPLLKILKIHFLIYFSAFCRQSGADRCEMIRYALKIRWQLRKWGKKILRGSYTSTMWIPHMYMGANTENVNTKRTHWSDECVLEHGINTLMFQMLDLHNEDIDWILETLLASCRDNVTHAGFLPNMELGDRKPAI